MTNTDWILDIALLLLVLRQLREAPVDRRFVLLPLGIVGYVAHSYLHSFPTAGNDAILTGTFIAIGAVLGIVGGIFTRVRFDGKQAFVRAGVVSAGLWVLGMGSRMGFQIWSDHGGAGPIARFSQAHNITSTEAWVTAFVLMAMTEVGTRVATIVFRSYRAATARPAASSTGITRATSLAA